MIMIKRGPFKPIIIVMAISLIILVFWNSFFSGIVHFLLDFSLGALLNCNLYLGIIIIAFLISLISILVQKFLTNQKELKKEQKTLQTEMN